MTGSRQDDHEHHRHDVGDVGSVSEEAAKLLGALGDWAKDQGHSYAGAAAAGASGVGDALREMDRHLATGAEECRYCPLCLLVAKVRATSPEVRTHLSSAATSLLAALAGMLATPVPDDAGRRGPVEKIDLMDGDGDDHPGPVSRPPADAQSGGDPGDRPVRDDTPWWASPGTVPDGSDVPEGSEGPDAWEGWEADLGGTGRAGGDFEDLAAQPRQRRTRRPCTDEGEQL